MYSASQMFWNTAMWIKELTGAEDSHLGRNCTVKWHFTSLHRVYAHKYIFAGVVLYVLSQLFWIIIFNSDGGLPKLPFLVEALLCIQAIDKHSKANICLKLCSQICSAFNKNWFHWSNCFTLHEIDKSWLFRAVKRVNWHRASLWCSACSVMQ